MRGESTQRLKSGEYEQLVHDLVLRLAEHAQVETTDLRRDVHLTGRATTSQIDVVWDFQDSFGNKRRVIFEARSYRRRIEQNALQAFRGVVDDLQSDERPVLGVVVTTSGYQRGAQAVASTYGVMVLELRSPDAGDLAGRVHTIHFEINGVVPVLEELTLVTAELIDAERAGAGTPPDQICFQRPGEAPELLRDFLWHDELGSLEDPAPRHRVHRTFEPAAALLLEGVHVANISEVSAVVGSERLPRMTSVIGGPETIAWMLRDALTDARVWLAHDGRVWTTET